MVVVDGFAVFLNVLFLASGLAGVALAYDYLKRMGIEKGEYYALLLFTISGMLLMAYADDLIVVFLALELLSIPLYMLAGFARPRPESEEAALKYFLLGSFASGFVLYGVALIFGATASTGLPAIFKAVSAGTANLTLLLVGAGLITGRPGLQGSRCAVPHVDAGRLPGGASAGDRVHVGGGESRRVCRPAAGVHGRLSRPGGQPGPYPVGAGGADDAGRQHRCARPRATSSACWPIRASPTPATC